MGRNSNAQTVDGNIRQCGYFGKLRISSQLNEGMIQKFHPQVYAQEKGKYMFMQKCIHKRSRNFVLGKS